MPARVLLRLAMSLAVAFPAAKPALSRGRAAPSFPARAFGDNESTARWLAEYDRVAWLSSDLVMKEPDDVVARLAPEWFCFRDAEGAWHAVYGRLDAGDSAYATELHYVERAGAGLARTDAEVPPQLALRNARAIKAALAMLPETAARRGLRFNSYVRPVADGLLEVWLLPAGQPDGTLAFGAEVRCLFDAAGALLSKDDTHATPSAARPDPAATLEIDHRSLDVPSVGDIFFLLAFRNQFANVLITTRCYVTALIDLEGEEAWVHALRDSPECAAPSRRHVDVGRRRKTGG